MLGAPGAGKGTQGGRLAAAIGAEHVATGDLLRDEVEAGTKVGKSVRGYLDSGQLVPDQLILDLVTPKLADAVTRQGYILDGFPRSVGQAETLDRLISEVGSAIDLVVNLQVPESVLLKRLLDRAADQGRSDDSEDVIENRLRVFDETTRPLVDYYRAQGKLLAIEADRELTEVTAAILAGIDGHQAAASR